MMVRSDRQRGVTLVELMVTLAVGALLMFAVIPNIGYWMRATQVRNATESLQAGLQRARNEAVRRNRTVRFTLVSLADPAKMDNSCARSAASASWVVSLNDPAGRCGTAISDTVEPFIIERHPAADGGRNVTVNALRTDMATAAMSIAFDAFGRVTGADPIAVIDVNHTSGATDARSLSIEIATSGSIRTCDPKVTDLNDPRRCQILPRP